jgi:hypothetical protein
VLLCTLWDARGHLPRSPINPIFTLFVVLSDIQPLSHRPIVAAAPARRGRQEAEKKMFHTRFHFCILTGLLLALSPDIVSAEGAAAVGTTGDVRKDGIAFGHAAGYPTKEAASQAALQACRRFEGAPKAAANCRLVATFSGECSALANDPKPGTPGTGWAVAVSEKAAQDRALGACQAMAGADRVQYCTVERTKCDARKIAH